MTAGIKILPGTYQHPQAGIEARVTMVGKQAHWEDDDEFGRVDVDVPTVWYELLVDGRVIGTHHLPEAEFRERFKVPGRSRQPKKRPWC
jgi:hypothetical protein